MITAAEALAPTQTEFGSSRVAELQRCPTAHDLKYTQRIFPKSDAVYFDVGRYTHACLRYVNEGVIAGEERSHSDVIELATDLRAAEIAAGRMQPVAWDETDPVAEADRLAGIYYGTHGSENGGWPQGVKLLHCELLLEDHELRATCRADLVVSRGGEIIIPDTKTRGRVLPKDRADYARGLRTNEQFLRISALAQRHFNLPEPPSVWLDAIIKTPKAPKDPEAKWPVDRLLITFTQSDIDAWRENARRMIAVEDALRQLPVVRNYHECDPPIGQRCWAFNWCHGSAEQRAERFRKVQDA